MIKKGKRGKRERERERESHPFKNSLSGTSVPVGRESEECCQCIVTGFAAAGLVSGEYWQSLATASSAVGPVAEEDLHMQRHRLLLVSC